MLKIKWVIKRMLSFLLYFVVLLPLNIIVKAYTPDEEEIKRNTRIGEYSEKVADLVRIPPAKLVA
jgi:hypothetical protein